MEILIAGSSIGTRIVSPVIVVSTEAITVSGDGTAFLAQPAANIMAKRVNNRFF